MKKIIFIILAFFLTSSEGIGGSGSNNETPSDYYHLFILSGQSNMQAMDIKYFLPLVEEEFGADHVIAVKDAFGNQSITQWYDHYDLEQDGEHVGWLYNKLMGKVFIAIEGKNIASVTFIWMQGEADGSKWNWTHFQHYKNNLLGLIELIKSDLETNINFVIGRLNTFAINHPEWDAIRKIQVEVAEGAANGTWVNTDDLGAGIHYNNYELLGERFAIAAISLINSN
jgi:hypothetical protein